MNPNDFGQSRPRGLPNGSHATGPARPAYDARNGAPATSGAQPNGIMAGSQSSRAERFEDEKRRLIESCFDKKEVDGSLSESYITHIRIEEDAAHPSSPPPLQSSSDNKKPRVIVVAVRKSGRVRMHKARENGNGTFSIGKTWVLDDLTVIESFTNSVPTSAEEQQNKQRAGNIGFTVTIQKPYYWQAVTAKEKDFFIFSLIKIFKKYTGGRLPDLLGFSSAELEQLGGASSSNQSAAGAQGKIAGPAARVANQDSPSVRDSPSIREPWSQASTPDLNHVHPHQEMRNHGSEPPGLRGQEPARVLHSTASRERSLRSASSNDRIHVPGAFPSTDSVNNQHVPSQLRQKRSESPGSQSTMSQHSAYRRRDDNVPDALRPAVERTSGDKILGYRPSNEQLRPQNSSSNSLLPQVLRTANSAAPLSTAPERSTIAVDKGEFHESLRQEELAPQRPPPLTSRSYQRPSPAAEPVNGTPRQQSPPKAKKEPPQVDNSVDSDKVLAFRDPKLENGIKPVPATDHMLTRNEGTARSRNNSQTPAPLVLAASTSSLPSPEPETPTGAEDFRPGLGPMIKRKSTKEIASTFRKAAIAASAFKPRAGGAGDKVQADPLVGGDGITGVFQAPSILRGISQDDSRPSTPKDGPTIRPSTPQRAPEISQSQLTTSPVKIVETQTQQEPLVVPIPASIIESTSVDKQPEERRKRRRSDHSARYAKILGIHPSLLDGRTTEIDDLLDDFGWKGGNSEKVTFEDLQSSLRKELANVEAGSWLGAVESNEDRTAAVGDMLDRVMTECDELDCLLTLYNVELGTLTEDVAYIEAQSQGLLVQTANQKLLHTELKNLLENMSISSSDLQILKDTSLAKPQGIQDVEHTLAQLYAAMLTIDPTLVQSNVRLGPGLAANPGSSSNGHGANQLSSMLAVREKREGFRRDTSAFIQRLKQYMSVKFRETEAATVSVLEKRTNAKSSSDGTTLDPGLREEPRRPLWLYSPLLLFVRETEPMEWDDLLRMYEASSKKSYQDEFKDNLFSWKRVTRKAIGDEQDILFTSQEKEPDSLVGRKLTVKRAKTVRSDGTSRFSGGERVNDGRITAYEAFAGALTETAKLIFFEQNFIVDIFHASSVETQDFIDAIAVPPDQRRGNDLFEKRPFDPDRDMARKLLGVMEDLFSSWPSEIQGLVDWSVKHDPLNVIGVLFALESQLAEVEETNQEFLAQAVAKIHDRLVIHLNRFIEEQIRGIEDTKVKINKRKGIITFIKNFPNFSTAVENMLPPTRSLEHLAIRSLVNESYQSINKAMFESLKFIAKETPSATAGSITAGDPEDKEALNHHILLIENMNHYIEEVPVRNISVLEEWKFRARAEMSEHTDLYISAVIRRPLGKLLDFLESTESLVKNLPSTQAPSSIADRASHSRSVFKKLLASYDGREVRRGAETLRKRVEKHFLDADETPGLSKELINKVLRECENRYADILNRLDRLIRDIYGGGLEVEWKREDVAAGFKR